MNRAKILLTAIFAIVYSCNLSAQIIPEWATTYVANYPLSIDQREMETDKDGNTYVLGYTTDTSYIYNTVLLKYDQFGQFLWMQHYDSISYFTKLSVDEFGNSYILGYSFSNSNSLLTIKYNTQGVFQWAQFYATSTSCWPSDIITDDSSNVYITGSFNNNHYTTIKYNSMGVLMWAVIDAQINWQGHSVIALDEHKNVYLAIAEDDSTSAVITKTIKYNRSGIKQWEQVYTSNFIPGFSSPVSIKFDPNGFVYVLASNNNQNNGESDYAVVKYDTLGNKMWSTTYSFTNYYDGPTAFVIDKIGNVYVTGSIWPSGGYADSIATIKISASGTFKWKRLYSAGYSNLDVASDIVIDSLDYIYVGGVSSDNLNDENFVTIKYDSLGNEIWVGRYKSGAFNSDYANSISLDKYGNIYLSGTTYGFNSSGMTTIKYSNNVGIRETKNDYMLNVYPNPTNSVLNIIGEQNQLQNATISITNYLGQSALSIPFSNKIDLSQLSSGMYFLTVQDKERKRTVKVIKQ